MKYQWKIWTKRHLLRTVMLFTLMQLTDAFYPKRLALLQSLSVHAFPGKSHPDHDLQLKHICVCLCQEWLASSCVLPGSPCVWLGLLNRSCIHRRSVRATWNPCRGSTASDARPRKAPPQGEHVCVCVFVQPLIRCRTVFADLRLRVNRATTESDMVPESCHHRSA